jgi:beta-N-acetylhexosaminidase
MVLVLAGVGVAGHELSSDSNGGSVPPAQQEGRQGTSFLARLIPPPPEQVTGPNVPRSIADLARRLPLEREVAQLFLFGFSGRDATAPFFRQLQRLDLGGAVLEERNYTDPQQLASLAGEIAATADREKHVPPWILAAQEGGDFSEFRDLPPAEAPGDLRSAAEAAAAARETAATLIPLGLNGVLAPVIDVESEKGALQGRSYSADPDAVARFGVATVRAYARAGMLAAVRSFPGLGSASQPTEEGPATVGLSLDQLMKRDLVPFKAAFDAGALATVIGSGLYATDDFVTPASMSSAVTTDLLRKKLHYRGLAITDDLADAAISSLSSIPDAAVAALKAGADMVWISGGSGDQQAAYLAVLNAVRRGQIPRARVDEALYRVLTIKHDLGLIR